MESFNLEQNPDGFWALVFTMHSKNAFNMCQIYLYAYTFGLVEPQLQGWGVDEGG